MTNVSRPIHLQLQRPATAMVSSSSGTSPFGGGGGGGGAAGGIAGLDGSSGQLISTPGAAQQLPPQPAPRSTPIRPNALINFNCIAKTPTIPSNLASPTIQMATMSRSSRSTPGECFAPTNAFSCHPTKALSPSGLNDSLPTQIMPHLFVGNQEQTNRETVNKLNIKYILSLGLLPMIMANTSHTSVTTLSPITTSASNKKASGVNRQQQKSHHHHSHHHHHHHHHPQSASLMPLQNSSRDFKIRIRSHTPTTPTTPNAASLAGGTPLAATTPSATQQASIVSPAEQNNRPNSSLSTTTGSNSAPIPKPRDENKGIKQVRSVYCKCINIADNSDQLLDKFFDEAYAFIEEARRKKCNILIHCLAGISRSPTIAIAYLMRVRSLHWKDAYDLVKHCRPQIDPNLNFMGQLRIYNKSLRDERSTTSANRLINVVNDASALPEADCQTAVIIGHANNCTDRINAHSLMGLDSGATITSSNLRDKDNT